jgi:hypothetical protein
MVSGCLQTRILGRYFAFLPKLRGPTSALVEIRPMVNLGWSRFDVAIGLWFNLGRTVGFLILIPFLVPAAWLSFFRDRVVEIAQYDEETIVLSFKRPGYAREFLQVNQGKASLIGLRTSIGSFASPSELADLTQRLTAEAHAHA